MHHEKKVGNVCPTCGYLGTLHCLESIYLYTLYCYTLALFLETAITGKYYASIKQPQGA